MKLLKTIKNKELINNYLWTFLQFSSKYVYLFFLSFISAYFLDEISFGILSYVLVFLTFLLLFSDFGFSSSLYKYTSETFNLNKKNLKLILFPSFILIFLISSLVTIFLLLYIFLINKNDVSILLLFIIPVLYLIPFTSILDGFLKGIGEFKLLGKLYFYIMLFILPITLFLVYDFGIYGALISYNFLYFLFFLFLFINTISFFSVNFSFKRVKRIFNYGLNIGFIYLAFFFFFKIDIFILGLNNEFNIIAIYELFNKLVLFTLLPFLVLSTILKPKIITLNINKKFNVMQTYFLKTFLSILFISIIISISFFHFTPFFMSLFFDKYINVNFQFFLLFFSLLIPFMIIKETFFSSFLISINKVKLILYSSLFFGILNLLISFIFYDLLGAYFIIIFSLFCFILSVLIPIFYYFFFLSKLK